MTVQINVSLFLRRASPGAKEARGAGGARGAREARGSAGRGSGDAGPSRPLILPLVRPRAAGPSVTGGPESRGPGRARVEGVKAENRLSRARRGPRRPDTAAPRARPPRFCGGPTEPRSATASSLMVDLLRGEPPRPLPRAAAALHGPRLPGPVGSAEARVGAPLGRGGGARGGARRPDPPWAPPARPQRRRRGPRARRRPSRLPGALPRGRPAPHRPAGRRPRAGPSVAGAEGRGPRPGPGAALRGRAGAPVTRPRRMDTGVPRARSRPRRRRPGRGH